MRMPGTLSVLGILLNEPNEEIVAIPCKTSTDPDTGVVAWASGWSPDERLVHLQYGDVMRY